MASTGKDCILVERAGNFGKRIQKGFGGNTHRPNKQSRGRDLLFPSALYICTGF